MLNITTATEAAAPRHRDHQVVYMALGLVGFNGLLTLIHTLEVNSPNLSTVANVLYYLCTYALIGGWFGACALALEDGKHFGGAVIALMTLLTGGYLMILQPSLGSLTHGWQLYGAALVGLTVLGNALFRSRQDHRTPVTPAPAATVRQLRVVRSSSQTRTDDRAA